MVERLVIYYLFCAAGGLIGGIFEFPRWFNISLIVCLTFLLVIGR